MVDPLGPRQIGPMQSVKQVVPAKDRKEKKPDTPPRREEEEEDEEFLRKGRRIDDHA